MKLFPCGHATHPHWGMAAALALAQLRAQLAQPGYAQAPTLGLLYITDHYANDAQDILDFLGAELPELTDWVGTVGVGVLAGEAEYLDEPALAVMLCELPTDQYRVFSGVAPLGLGFEAQTALVHADPHTADVAELIGEMAARTDSGRLFGGLASSRSAVVQFAAGGSGNIRGHGAARGVFSGGLSGVALGAGVRVVSRVTQGCEPVAPQRLVTAAEGNVLLTLDGEPALEVLLRDLAISLEGPLDARSPALDVVRATLVGLSVPGQDAVRRTGNFSEDVTVRHIIGLDPARRAVALADQATAGMRVAFCQRNVTAARADLVRICTEIRDELEREAGADTLQSAPRMAGAVYVSCTGRGGAYFGGPSAEMQIIRHALGDVPLVGFLASGEIAGRRLYNYAGVLTVFTDAAPAAPR